MFDADNWCIKVSDKVYGPYTGRQMRAFAEQGRLAAWSYIAPAGSRAWRQAQEEPNFARLFGVEPADGSTKQFGKRDAADDNDDADGGEKTPDGAHKRETDTPAGPAAPAKTAAPVGPARKRREAELLIVFDAYAESAMRAESAMLDLGDAFALTANVWYLKSALTPIGVRNALTPYVAETEPLFVVDMATGRTAWRNFAPDLHARLTVALMAPKARKQAV
ncbi:MAG: hypothetical protein AAGC56_10875 [Pseudomonadota bacterium]